MMLSFSDIINLIAETFFAGSTTMAGLSLIIAAWAIAAIICLNLKAPPAYTVVPMIPITIFFAAYGILNESITILIVIISAALVAMEFRRVAD